MKRHRRSAILLLLGLLLLAGLAALALELGAVEAASPATRDYSIDDGTGAGAPHPAPVIAGAG